MVIIVVHLLVGRNEPPPFRIPPRRSENRRRGRLSTVTDSFPRRQARTRRFTLGTPRGVALSPDGTRATFLRSRGGTDAVTCLWSLDVTTGDERMVADPRTLEAGGDEDLPPEERARRERAREQAGGIVSYATDRAATLAAFALSGRPHVVDLVEAGSTPRPLDAPGPVVDPRPDPTGSRVAYVSGGALHVHDLAAGTTTAVARPESGTVTYGLADFVAAEEMSRMRGYWWAPDGGSLLVARVDDAPVRRWHIADPANPEREPSVVAYPAAGTSNARVSLAVAGLDGTRVDVAWDADRDEYLAHVVWSPDELLIVVQPRDQRALRVLRVDPASGATTVVHEDADPFWVEIVPGVPARTASGALLWITDDGDARRLIVDGEPVTPPSLQVRAVLDVDDDTVLFAASDDPVSTALWTWSAADGPGCLTPEPGVHDGRLTGGTLVVIRQSLDADGTVTTVRPESGIERTITSLAEPPGLQPRITLHTTGERALRSALLLPSWHEPGTPLPVLMDPYGGPHAQRVVAARGAHLTSQWFADQGFAVVVVDGRGTPGRGPTFERAVWGDLAAPVLDDQVDALHALAADHPDLDLTRVGIRGWSFGGYLAALAVLRRPDVFHAAVAGAPVTDWTLYDTHYTERYLGRPDTHPDAYARTSLLPDAAKLTRPLLLVHGLADDNVVAAHTLRLSSALLAGGRSHSVLPLSGVTHMTPQEVVAENLLLLQVDFLRDALGIVGPPTG
jgi:dipeptidyl-peptidase-4